MEQFIVKTTTCQTARPRLYEIQIACISALALIGLVGACSTAKPSTSAANKTETSSVGAATTTAQSDYAISPIDVTIKPEVPPKSADPVRPWLVLKSIGFFYDRADLSGWEAIKITEIVTYVALHPGAELGINRPAVATDGNPAIDDLNHRRVRTIINGLITAGVSEDRIQIGNYRDLPLSPDQQVEVFVRGRL